MNAKEVSLFLTSLMNAFACFQYVVSYLQIKFVHLLLTCWPTQVE